ncbi:MAG: hypothetical protein CME68_06775 [Halobacteriovoraceae bacterium]|nr:hypothetical protein [Halobacteriovoraceae bacterium]|tara:strand:- start:64 stop:456 length:393 start_codon:yes stop_codon:yes gene_type:complete
MKKSEGKTLLERLFGLVCFGVLLVPAISFGQMDIDSIERKLRRLETKVYSILDHVEELEALNQDLEERLSLLERRLGRGDDRASWICKIETTFKTYSAVGNSRALAEEKVIKKCKKDTLESNCRGATCSN